jgi:hypothetical protein
VTAHPGNGIEHPADDDGLDDDDPLDPAEAAAADAEALEEGDESLDERVESVIEELQGVERVRDRGSVIYRFRGKPFAVLLDDGLEVVLDPVVAKAALRTASTLPSPRGPGWIAFTPRAIDRFALDRAEAWVRSAHRRAAGG